MGLLTFPGPHVKADVVNGVKLVQELTKVPFSLTATESYRLSFDSRLAYILFLSILYIDVFFYLALSPLLTL